MLGLLARVRGENGQRSIVMISIANRSVIITVTVDFGLNWP